MNVPFPEAIARPYSERIGAEYQASVEARRRGGRGPEIGAGVTRRDALGFRLPDGKLRIVYDHYRPTYPDGAVPGWLDYIQTLHVYPNETQGYTFHVLPDSFRPLTSEGVAA